jgi:uncharacterized protein (DUF433 family)
MDAVNWTGCPLVISDIEIVRGEPVFAGTRLPVSAINDSMDGYVDDGVPLEQAIVETLENFPSVPNGADGIRSLLACRDAHEYQLSLESVILDVA